MLATNLKGNLIKKIILTLRCLHYILTKTNNDTKELI